MWYYPVVVDPHALPSTYLHIHTAAGSVLDPHDTVTVEKDTNDDPCSLGLDVFR
jgi:hypothetical protein